MLRLASFDQMEVMQDWALPLVMLAAYFAIMRWVLPRFGVST